MTARTVVVVQGASGAGEVPGIDGIDAELRFAATADKLGKVLPGAEVLFGWNFAEANLRAVWPSADRLRWIHWSGAGVDAVLFPELVQSDVVLSNSRGIYDRAMAEYVLGLILALAKRFPESWSLQSQRIWRHRLGEQVRGSKALVVGVGSIGREIARMLRAVGLRVQGVGRRGRDDDPDFETIHGGENLNRAISQADYVIVIVPLTEETRAMIGVDQFEAMKPTARFINLARGAVVDEAALVMALEQGSIAGAALDVFEVEPLPEDSPLWTMANVIVSPHMSGDFTGYDEAVVEAFVENFRRFLENEPLANVVDKALGFVATGSPNKRTRVAQ